MTGELITGSDRSFSAGGRGGNRLYDLAHLVAHFSSGVDGGAESTPSLGTPAVITHPASPSRAPTALGWALPQPRGGRCWVQWRPPGHPWALHPLPSPWRAPMGRAGRRRPPRPFPRVSHRHSPFKAELGAEETAEEAVTATPSPPPLAPPALARGSGAQPKANPGAGALQRLRRLPAPLLAQASALRTRPSHGKKPPGAEGQAGRAG